MLRGFRYVEYSKAVSHMERTIKELKEMHLDLSFMESALARLKRDKARTNERR